MNESSLYSIAAFPAKFFAASVRPRRPRQRLRMNRIIIEMMRCMYAMLRAARQRCVAVYLSVCLDGFIRFRGSALSCCSFAANAPPTGSQRPVVVGGGGQGPRTKRRKRRRPSREPPKAAAATTPGAELLFLCRSSPSSRRNRFVTNHLLLLLLPAP